MSSVLYRLFVIPVRWLNWAVRSLSASTHRFQYGVEGLLQSSSEWFDHELDVHWQWPRLGKGGFLERGVLTALTIRPGGTVLDLCCGDGFYARHFFARRAARVLAVDSNRAALEHARRFNAAPNVSYQYCDVTIDIPPGPFDTVAWNAAIEHFTREESHAILLRVSAALAPGGSLCGHAVADPQSTYRYARQTFTGAEELAGLLGTVFPHVLVRTTCEPDRVNLYFFAGHTATCQPLDAARDDVVVREKPS
jgi:2-polyprenyl-3-methyl-5-hydroxy-6-metoxy-1,4-benzoquinol methylase